MDIREIAKIGKAYRLRKVILATGTMFTIEARKDECDSGWWLVECTADVGQLACQVMDLGLAASHEQALALLNS